MAVRTDHSIEIKFFIFFYSVKQQRSHIATIGLQVKYADRIKPFLHIHTTYELYVRTWVVWRLKKNEQLTGKK